MFSKSYRNLQDDLGLTIMLEPKLLHLLYGPSFWSGLDPFHFVVRRLMHQTSSPDPWVSWGAMRPWGPRGPRAQEAQGPKRPKGPLRPRRLRDPTHGAPMVPTPGSHGTPHGFPWVISIDYLWMISMDYIHGWYVWMISIDEMYGWYLWMICIDHIDWLDRLIR